ncbi:hypothetical protein CP162_08685 [Corynebacterium pseudotuberculosis Cp162]|nr:hypothetical protein CP162_08685 [Corynebacterium pseudotuberculosis Cp162]APG82386.1 Hypothetical protein CPI37_1758 [Corynebacterium pseudotuberculosis]
MWNAQITRAKVNHVVRFLIMTLSFIGYFSSGAALERNELGTAIELLELCGGHGVRSLRTCSFHTSTRRGVTSSSYAMASM